MERNHEEIRKRIIRSSANLIIQRVPEKTIEWFKGFANEEFCSDYGMTLKFLCDFFTGLVPTGTEHIEVEIEQLNQRLTKLEEGLVKKEEKVRKRIDGSVIKNGKI